MGEKVKAIVLLSGGLDSTLAAKVLQEQGVDLIGVGFSSPFYSHSRGEKASKWLKIPFIKRDISLKIWEIVKAPKHGYGKNMNPCIDCHTLMLKEAKSLMGELRALFVATGEVLGERPMSQNRKALQLVAKEAGLEGLVLRPLSAKLLPETIPEKKGWVDREKLLEIEGRSRKVQMELAEEYGLKDYSTPAGGCLLTDPEFSKRLKNLLSRRKEADLEDVKLLKLGRHFFLDDVWIVIPRNKRENLKLEELVREDDLLIRVLGKGSPLTLVRGKTNSDVLREAALLTIRYSQARDDDKAQVEVKGVCIGERKSYEREEWEKYLR
jgi:tRNA U34 2-thiouridine synthase MnmA/TrmU